MGRNDEQGSFPAAASAKDASMTPTLLVMIGGAIGAAARFQLGNLAGPYATLTANILGGFAMGLLAALVVRAEDPARLLLGTGLLGGFTTFSAFSLETLTMIERGQAGAAFLYVAASVLGALAALLAGLSLGRAAA